jgi:hypothetical protein
MIVIVLTVFEKHVRIVKGTAATTSRTADDYVDAARCVAA